MTSCSTSVLAILTAVNCADEYFKNIRLTNDLKSKNEQLEKDTQHYVQLWDEAKKNFLQYKEDAKTSIENKQELQRLYDKKRTSTINCLLNLRNLQKGLIILKRLMMILS